MKPDQSEEIRGMWKPIPTSAPGIQVVEHLPRFAKQMQRLTQVRTIQDLPQAARDYIQFIGNELATPIDVVSVGPGREQTLWIKPLF